MKIDIFTSNAGKKLLRFQISEDWCISFNLNGLGFSISTPRKFIMVCPFSPEMWNGRLGACGFRVIKFKEGGPAGKEQVC